MKFFSSTNKNNKSPTVTSQPISFKHFEDTYNTDINLEGTPNTNLFNSIV